MTLPDDSGGALGEFAMGDTAASIAWVIAESTMKALVSETTKPLVARCLRFVRFAFGRLIAIISSVFTCGLFALKRDSDMSKDKDINARVWALDNETPRDEPTELPPVEAIRSGDRKQLYLPRELLDLLEKYADGTGQKVAPLAAESVAIFLKLMGDQNRRGDILPSKTSHHLRRLAVHLGVHPGDIVRASTAIGCRLLEESSESQEQDRVLFDDLVDEAKSQGRTVPGLLAQYVRAGLASDRKGGKKA